MAFPEVLETFFNRWADLMWGTPLVVLLVGGGLYFMIHSAFRPYRYFGHAINLVLGKYSLKATREVFPMPKRYQQLYPGLWD